MPRSFALTCGLWMISPTSSEPAIGKLPPRLIGVLDRALDAVAEAELLREPDGDVLDRERVVVLAQRVDDAPVVVGGQVALDVRLEAEAFAEIGARARRWGPWREI